MLVDGAHGVLVAAGGLTIPLGAALLAAAGEPALRGPRRLRPAAIVVGAALVAVAGLGALGLALPALVPVVPGARTFEATALVGAGLACLLVVGVRAARTVLLTRRIRDAVATGGVALLGGALVAGWTWSWTHLGFWMGHGFELAGLVMLGAAAALDLRDGAPSRALHGDLRAAEMVLREEAFLGVQVRALMRRLAAKDASTEGHTRRVAILATRVGEALRLPPARLRELALAGLLHDVGKLQVPDAVLRKPGPLTDEEFAVIRTHPGAGDALLASLGGFSPGVRAVVRGHHERLDGRGYPDGRRGDAIDLPTRIMAVCDVYDALVTARVYRAAWSHGDAVALLERESGTGFDPVCVAALQRVLGAAGDGDGARYDDVVALAETAAAREDADPR
jgi:HD-GYP domain-containing protein (c-di-GMP phosphodiesterase class II)